MSEQPTPTYVQPEAQNLGQQPLTAHRKSRSASWIGGAVLIGLGVIVLLQNMGIEDRRNWGALLLLIPAVGAFAHAWRSYLDSGRRISRRVGFSFFGGLALTMVSMDMLFNVNWTYIGPVILILLGAVILLNSFVGKDEAGQ